MGQDVHTVESPTGFQLAQQDRILIGNLPNVVTPAGGSAGATVTKTFTGLRLPANYSVQVSASQACDASVTGKTNTGFTVTLTPPQTSITLAAGTIDVTVIA
jgi:hypothetical protein